MGKTFRHSRICRAEDDKRPARRPECGSLAGRGKGKLPRSICLQASLSYGIGHGREGWVSRRDVKIRHFPLDGAGLVAARRTSSYSGLVVRMGVENDMSWENRVLCPDGCCTGTLTPEGLCTTCRGRWRQGGESWFEDNPLDLREPEQEGQALGMGWERRVLCPDGCCTGTINDEGFCRTCERFWSEKGEDWIEHAERIRHELPVESLSVGDFRCTERGCSGTIGSRARCTRCGKNLYYEYLGSARWKHLRHEAVKAAKYRCQLCNSGGPLNVHHRTYRRVGSDEEISDLIVLCKECHKGFDHSKIRS